MQALFFAVQTISSTEDQKGVNAVSTMFCWEPEGHYHHGLGTAIVALMVLVLNRTSLNSDNALLALNLWYTHTSILVCRPYVYIYIYTHTHTHTHTYIHTYTYQHTQTFYHFALKTVVYDLILTGNNAQCAEEVPENLGNLHAINVEWSAGPYVR